MATGLRGWEKEWVVVGGGIWLGAGEEGVSIFGLKKTLLLLLLFSSCKGGRRVRERTGGRYEMMSEGQSNGVQS